jgi:hypothetical protein
MDKHTFAYEHNDSAIVEWIEEPSNWGCYESNFPGDWKELAEQNIPVIDWNILLPHETLYDGLKRSAMSEVRSREVRKATLVLISHAHSLAPECPVITVNMDSEDGHMWVDGISGTDYLYQSYLLQEEILSEDDETNLDFLNKLNAAIKAAWELYN